MRQTKYRDEVFGFTTPLFSSQLEMLCERGFPLLRRINKILGKFRDYGLMSKLRNDFRYNSTILIAMKELISLMEKGEQFDEGILNEVDDNSEDESESQSGPIPLRPEHLMGAISLLIFGLVLSLVMFTIEYITNTNFFKRIWVKFARKFGKFNIDLKSRTKSCMTWCFNRIKCNLKIPEFLRKKLFKKEVRLLKRKVRKFAYRPIRFTPKSRRVPLATLKKGV